MSGYFLDSSALVKRYVQEIGTAWIQSITATSSGHMIFVSHITSIETASAIMRRMRQGSVPPRTARAARLLIDRHHFRQYQVIRMTDTLIIRAEDLLEQHALRASDALQLASALDINVRLTAANLPAITFVSNDQRLLTAAMAEGLPIDDPVQHP